MESTSARTEDPQFHPLVPESQLALQGSLGEDVGA